MPRRLDGIATAMAPEHAAPTSSLPAASMPLLSPAGVKLPRSGDGGGMDLAVARLYCAAGLSAGAPGAGQATAAACAACAGSNRMQTAVRATVKMVHGAAMTRLFPVIASFPRCRCCTCFQHTWRACLRGEAVMVTGWRRPVGRPRHGVT